MTGKGRLVALAVVGLFLAAIGGDWVQAQARLPNISITGQLDQPKVIADGKSSILLNVRVTENGQPRANALLQAWLESGGGLLIPEWIYTDEDGRAEYTYTPNAAGPYDSAGGYDCACDRHRPRPPVRGRQTLSCRDPGRSAPVHRLGRARSGWREKRENPAARSGHHSSLLFTLLS